MMGDSHTQAGNWNKLLTNKRVYNRGLGGFTSEQIAIQAKKNSEFFPKIVFVMAGGNDLDKANFSLNQTVKNIISIGEISKRDGLTVVFQSLLKKNNAPDFNLVIDSINNRIRIYTDTTDCFFLHLHPMLYQEGEKPIKDLDADASGHLNEKGYEYWSQSINTFLERHPELFEE